MLQLDEVIFIIMITEFFFLLQGDSGGPMSCSYDGKYYITGVVSWGSEDCKQKGYPSVFTRVTSYLNWINKHVSRG